VGLPSSPSCNVCPLVTAPEAGLTPVSVQLGEGPNLEAVLTAEDKPQQNGVGTSGPGATEYVAGTASASTAAKELPVKYVLNAGRGPILNA